MTFTTVSRSEIISPVSKGQTLRISGTIAKKLVPGLYSLDFMAFGVLEGAFPQPVVDAPVSSTSPHPGLVSFGSPQADVPLSGAGGVLLLQTAQRRKL